MKRAHLLGAIGLALPVTLVALVVSAGGQTTPAPAPADFTVTVTNPDSRRFIVDNTPPADRLSPGDMVGGRATISGGKSGSFDFSCVAGRRGALQCDGSSSFSDGVIYRRAIITGDEGPLLIAIVGGTGAYNGVKGTITSVTQSRSGGREVTRETYDFVE